MKVILEKRPVAKLDIYIFIKGILKLILVIFCISWKLAIGYINDIYETLTRFLSMKLCKSDIIRW